jgi:hypothetical protein
MPTSVATTNTTTTKPKPRRSGGGGSRGFGRRRGSEPTQRKSQDDPAPTESTDAADTPATPTTTTLTVENTTTVAENTEATSQDGDTETCWICAEPVKYYSVSECNHRTCHVCALRLRALYKRQECTFCKVCLSFTYRNEPESINGFPFLIGTPTFLGLHDIPHRDVHIIQSAEYPL